MRHVLRNTTPLAALVLAVTAMPTDGLAFSFVVPSQLSFIIEETGPAEDPDYALKFQLFERGLGGVRTLTSPAGNSYSQAPDQKRHPDLLANFDTLGEALDYLQGSWGVDWEHPDDPLTTPTMDRFSLLIDAIEPAAIMHEKPLLRWPSPDATLESGVPTLIGWDYPPGVAPSQSYFSINPMLGSDDRTSQFRRSRPVGGAGSFSSWTSGDGDEMLTMSLRTAANTNEYRYEFSVKTTAATPTFDIELIVGSSFNIENAVTTDDLSGLALSREPTFRVIYSRLNDPVRITVLGVPEPQTICLLAILLGAAGTASPRVLGSHCYR